MERTLWIGLLGVLLCSSSVNSYSKYGRKCQDIGCRSDEECVMAEDPCPIGSRDRNSCGSYPTCARKTGGGGLSCSALVCSPGQYCKTVDGHPKCVSTTSNSGYDSAGVSSVNGHRTNTDDNHGSSSSNYNPYSHANAPPPDPSYDTNYHTVNSANNNGYPQYPSTSGNNPSYAGYPRPPSSGTNLGYPPYPTQNRMPQPGVYQQPGHYPAGNYPGYPSNQPGHQYPNYPYQNHYNTHSRKYGHSAGVSNSPQILSICFASILLFMTNGFRS